MRCPECGHPEMVTKVCDEILSYGGKSVIQHDMKGDFCPECGEGVWDAESYRRYTEEQTKIAGRRRQ
jgi:HTH-type transcriptional regulator/antitoxin MqsA